MKSKIIPVLALVVCGPLFACGSGPSASNIPAVEAGAPAQEGHGYRVTEVIQAGKYTYVQVERDGETLWAAAPQFEVEVGDDVVLPEGMVPMKEWHSKTLDRTWDVVHFAGVISKLGAELPMSGHTRPAATEPVGEFDFSTISAPQGGQTVAELYAQKAAFAGKPVVVRGIVVKVANSIMGRNWVHVRDGSGGPGTNDLTVTTSASCEVGDTVVVRGGLGTNIDFGAGYVFDVIVEDAELTIE